MTYFPPSVFTHHDRFLLSNFLDLAIFIICQKSHMSDIICSFFFTFVGMSSSMNKYEIISLSYSLGF